MKAYPSILYVPPSVAIGKKVVAFDKIDGSNIRAEWSKKKGFYKFGSRKRLIDANDHQFGTVVPQIKEMEDVFAGIFKDRKVERAMCFFEYWGPNSKFGQHDPNDTKKATLIDVSVYRKGIISPDDFIEWFVDVETAPVVFQGKLNSEFFKNVSEGSLEGMGREGVVCKSGFEQKLGGPWMTKVKRQSWFDELRVYVNGDEKKFKELE